MSKIRRNFGLLYREVIKPGYCAVCGACAGVCPVNAIEIDHHLPKLVSQCVNCGACIDVCLRINQRIALTKTSYKNILGEYIRVLKAESTDKEIQETSQNGGVVTSILLAAYNNNLIDAAILTDLGHSIFSPRIIIAENQEVIKKAARSKYALNPLLTEISAVKYSSKKKFAVVGLPCHLEALDNIIKEGYYNTNKKVKYKIGLFCMRSYFAELLELIVTHETGLSPENIIRTEIRSGKLILESLDGMQELPLKALKDARVPGCRYCKDLTNRHADIAIGNIGVEDNKNIVIIRTKKGEKLIDLAIEKGYLKVIETDAEMMKQIIDTITNVGEKKLKYSRDMPELEV